MAKKKKNNKQLQDNRIAGFIGTVIVHLLLLLALYFIWLKPVILDNSEEDGLTVNYGNSETGEGLFEPTPMSEIEPEPSSSEAAAAAAEEAEESLVAQDDESPEQIAKREQERKEKAEKRRMAQEEKRKKAKEEAEKKAKEEAERKAKQAVTDNANRAGSAFSKGGSSTSGSQGIAGGTGNQGKPEGDPDSNNYAGGGNGSGTGVSYKLGNRQVITPQSPPYNQNIAGKIVVEIEVDPQGKVVSAHAGAQGTTIGDATMRKIAEQTALKTKFSGSTGGTIQTGTITYTYKLR